MLALVGGSPALGGRAPARTSCLLLYLPPMTDVLEGVRDSASALLDDAVALRRLSLAAATSGAFAFLLRSSPTQESSTAATRWVVSAAPSQPRYGPGLPRINVQLVRNRRGPLGSWMLEWNEKDECFVLASTHPQPLATPPVDRPAGALVRSVA